MLAVWDLIMAQIYCSCFELIASKPAIIRVSGSGRLLSFFLESWFRSWPLLGHSFAQNRALMS